MKLLALVLLATGCDWSLNRMIDQPRCEPGKRAPWLPDKRCDQHAPAGTVMWRSSAAAVPEPAATRASILRGRDRFARFCAPCHGTLGNGASVTARDMSLRKPPSLLTPAVAAFSDQRIFDVISGGYGFMPAYSYQLPPEDRWAVVQFLRVLATSQAFPVAQLPAERRKEAEVWLR
ncbi:MAG: cytochrome c [Kofleriaceae bacterium]|nr:cytochrome c [Kofleriaceae bacterium]